MQDAYRIACLDAAQLVDLYRARELSPVEVLDAALQVVDDHEPVLNALWVRSDASATVEALASENRWHRGEPTGPIDGVPVTIKENLARVGIPMPLGCAGVTPQVPTRSSPVAERISEAGGVVLGSTVMPDWGMLSSGVSSLHGVTRSPWNPDWTTGGSSSGAGAACAAGYAPLHVGTDIGGSIRLPGTWLGLATLKPSAGRVPLDNPYLGRVAGPITRTIADTATLMSVIARPDARDWTAPAVEDRVPWTDQMTTHPHGLRVGLHLDAGFGMPVDPEVATLVARAGELFDSAGAQVETLEPFLRPGMIEDLDTFWRVRSWNDFVALDQDGRDRVLPFIRRWIHPAAQISGARVLGCYQTILELQRATVSATLPYDVVVSPVAPVAAFPADWPMPFGGLDGPDLGMAHIGFTAPYNMSGQPAATVNCGFTRDGRTVGIQIAGRRFDDIGVLRAAAWYEAARPADAAPHWPIAPHRRLAP
ncbi:MAG: amidase [Actinomycetota bacterium]|nr:amidase [Actinomycetota bacterium]